MKKFFKVLGLIVAAIGVLYLTLCFVGPQNLHIDESVTIKAPRKTVFEQIGDFKNWQNWSIWQLRDTTGMHFAYGEKTSGLDGSFTWREKDGSLGGQTFVGFEENVFTESRLVLGNNMSPLSRMELTDSSGYTIVRWTLKEAEIPFLKRGILFLLDVKSNVTNDYKGSLLNLRDHCEGKANDQKDDDTVKYKIYEESRPEQHFICIREELSFSQMQGFLDESFPKLYAAIDPSVLNGTPTGLYFSWDKENQKTDMAAGIPVKPGTTAPEGFKLEIVPASQCLIADYYGPYSGSEAAHIQLSEQLNIRGQKEKMPVMEDYVTDPTTEKDTSKWLTKVIYTFGPKEQME